MRAREDLMDGAWKAASRLSAGLAARKDATKTIEKEAAEVADYLAMIDALNLGGDERGLAATKLKEAREVLADG